MSFYQHFLLLCTVMCMLPLQGEQQRSYDSNYSLIRNRPVVGAKGLVVSDCGSASEWGAELLRLGGNAVDAAVGTAFALAVARPHYAAIGGGGFVVGNPCDAEPFALDFREVVPRRMIEEQCIKELEKNPDLFRHGPYASGVPGTVAGLVDLHEKHGLLPLSVVMKRPVEIALNGTPMSGNMYYYAWEVWDKMNDEARAIFGAPDGLSPKAPGELVVQDNLAWTLISIAHHGKKAFYTGDIAKHIIDGLQASGGIMELDDLEKYCTKERTPLVTSYKKKSIITMPPSSSGGIALSQLFTYAQLAEQCCAKHLHVGNSLTWHTLGQGLSLAFADRNQYVADPDFVTIPIETLLSKEYLQDRWDKHFNQDHFTQPSIAKTLKPGIGGTDTTHVSVMDKEGNAVSLTLTIHSRFGSGFVIPGVGILMNNQMDDFSDLNRFGLENSDLNSLQAYKRPLSSMTPTIVTDEKGNNQMVLGAAGGPHIISSIWQVLLNRLLFGMELSDAVSFSRVYHQGNANELLYEQGCLSPELCAVLTGKGYDCRQATEYAIIQALEKRPNGHIWGMSDPRSEGIAVAE